MNKHGVVALVAGSFLVGSEVADASEFDRRRNWSDVPHSHVETFAESIPSVTNLFSVSGGQSEKTRYFLQVVPAWVNGDPTAAGYRMYGFPDCGSQAMCGRFDNLETLITALESVLELPKQQLENIRRSLQGGTRTEIGGFHSRWFLREETMRNLGLRFGPQQ